MKRTPRNYILAGVYDENMDLALLSSSFGSDIFIDNDEGATRSFESEDPRDSLVLK